MLEVKKLKKAFGKEQVLSDVSLQLTEHEMLSILGRSGSGKTTLLKIIAGLEKADEGEVWLNDQQIDHIPPHQRAAVYLYQESLLFPHLNVFDNIAFGLRLRNKPPGNIQEMVQEMIEQLELKGQEKKMPHQLSGGQRQRVSFGRALIINPRVLLLDEPFGALDVETRNSMQNLLRRVAATYRITGVFVTHDVKEAILMGDRIGYMRQGKLDIYSGVEEFIADPRTEAANEIAFWKGLGDKSDPVS